MELRVHENALKIQDIAQVPQTCWRWAVMESTILQPIRTTASEQTAWIERAWIIQR